MRYSLSFDGGGTKLAGVLFDEEYRILAAAVTGGVNPNAYKPEQVRDSIHANISSLLGQHPVPAEAVDAVYVSQHNFMFTAVEPFFPSARLVVCGEGVLGVLSCGVTSGLCALSGTGSDVFWVREGETRATFGGWGYLYGDDGSGLDIGRQAARSLLSQLEGRIPEAALHVLLKRDFGICSKEDLLQFTYRAPCPPQFVASFCKTVAEAAREGCPLASEILYEAGRELGRLVAALCRQYPEAARLPICTTGGVFRHCGHVREAFEAYLLEHMNAPPRFLSPLFDPVAGGVVYGMLTRGHTATKEELAALAENSRLFAVYMKE